MKRLCWLLLALVAAPSLAKDKLVILSPHRQSIQQEFIPAFKKYYEKTYEKEVDVEWIDQGGTSDDVRFLRARFANNPKTSGIDLFWGGGSAVFAELAEEDLFAPYTLSDELQKQVPESAAGIPLYGKNNTWYGSAMSSFGIFYNKRVLAFDKIPAPKSWEDLAKPAFQGNISLTDPRRSGSANTMNTIILQGLGWEKGWELLTLIAANARSFTHSSTDPIKAVVSGDAAVALAIDFYALAQVGDLGEENLGFTMPEGQTVLDPDPVAILRGAPNREVAERFVEYSLSAEAQKLLVLPKGAKDGPRFATLGRMAVNKKTYELTEGRRTNDFNPFAQKSFMQLDLEKATKLQRVFNDLVGAILVDTHSDLRQAWERLIRAKKAEDPQVIAKFVNPPVSEKEFMEVTANWDNEVFRNKTINSWVQAAKAKYAAAK
ncbi:MAG: ABC transporter substrate-binding protein [Oligoflexus sp.]